MMAHLIASTVTGAAVVLLVLTLRRAPAQLRFALVLLALLRFAVPTSWLTAAGSVLARRMPLQTERVKPLTDWDLPLRRASEWTVAAPAAATARIPAGSLILTVTWAGGTLLCFGLWMTQARKRRPRVRAASDREEQALAAAHARFPEVEEPELRVAHSQASTGALGIWRHQIVLPDGLSHQLSDEELVAIFSHELAHFSRWDNLTALAARLVVSMFWYHPLVWWLERGLLAERELACDELVLARGTGISDYASALSKASRATVLAETGYALMAGQNLKRRLERIMLFSFAANLRSNWRGLPVATAALVLMLPVSIAYLNAQSPRSDPRADTLYLEANLAYSKHDYAAAEQMFQRLRTEFPADGRGVYGLAEMALVTQRPQEARAMLEQELSHSPNPRGIQMALANISVRTGDYVDAIGRLERLSEQQPEDADLQMRLGEAYQRAGELQKALPHWESAHRLAPANTAPLFKIALIQEMLGDPANARSTYEAVLAIDPQNWFALNNLAYLLSETAGQGDIALSHALRAKMLRPEDTDVADTLGWVYLKQGRAPDALRELAQGVPKSSKPGPLLRPLLRQHLAATLEQINPLTPELSELKGLLVGGESPANDERIRALLTSLK